MHPQELECRANRRWLGHEALFRSWRRHLKPSARGDLGVGLLDRLIDSLDRALEKIRTGFDDPFADTVRGQESPLLEPFLSVIREKRPSDDRARHVANIQLLYVLILQAS